MVSALVVEIFISKHQPAYVVLISFLNVKRV